MLLSATAAFSLNVMVTAYGGESRVADAAMQGDRETVRTLLKQGVDVNAAQGDGTTALHWAARSGDVDLAQMLLYAGANVRATTRLGGYTPLIFAAETGNAAMLDALLKAGADPKIASSTGVTPLMMAAKSGKADAVRLLIERGADVNAKEPVRGETALMFATAYNRVDAMKALIDKGADVKEATKVVDLTRVSPEDEAFIRQQIAQFGGQAQGGRGGRGGPAAAPGAPPQNAAAAAPAAGGRGGRGGRGGAPNAPANAAAGQPGQPDVQALVRQFRGGDNIKTQGGLTPLLFAARNGFADAAAVLLAAGADVNQVNPGDKTSPLLLASINGHYDLAKTLLDKGANPNLAAENGATPLYAVLNCEWAPKALYPQPRAYTQQKMTHLELMKALLEKGADPNARLKKKVWYSGYNFDLSGVDEIGATPFWRAAYGADVEAMKLLIAYGADSNIPTMRPAGRPRTGDAIDRDTIADVSALPPIPTGGPGVPPLLAAAGVGYGEGFAANSHRYAPGGMLEAVKYLVEELHVDVNARDHEGNTALHDAAARGDNEMIKYLVSKGADPKAVNREGNTTIDMANGPVQRTQPFPETITLLEGMGVKNNHKCKSC
jgi:ankyrin repeat protein